MRSSTSKPVALAGCNSQGWYFNTYQLPTENAKLSTAERLASIKNISKPVFKGCCAALAPISAMDDGLLALEFLFWIICLFAPVLALYLASHAIIYQSMWSLLSVVVLVFLCTETFTQDLYPNSPPTANSDRFARYLTHRIIFEDPDFYSKRNMIFPFLPHGIFPASLFCFLLLQKRTPIWRVVAAQASVTLWFPYWRQFSRWLGSVPAGRKEIERQLGNGLSVTTFMDGIHGMFAGTDPLVEKLYVSNKKGLIKIALRTGTPLVPVYCFGQTRLVSTVQDPCGFMMRLSRRLGVSFVLPVGRFFLPIPVRTPVTCVFGHPINVEAVKDPRSPLPKEKVEALHRLFIQETVALFERHKNHCGYDGCTVSVE